MTPSVPDPAAVERMAEEAARAAAPYEFRTFLLGTREPAAPLAGGGDEGAAEAVVLYKRAWNAAVGRRLESLWAPARTVDFGEPEATLRLDPERGRVEVFAAPLFLAGRYQKLSRMLPESRWPHLDCRGRGCAGCDGRGKVYPDSVEELVAAPLIRATGAAGSKLHAVGREDIDARMLGSGRPFVLELSRPVRRTVDLAAAAAAIAASGRVFARGLRPVARAVVAAAKGAQPQKTYRAICWSGAPLAPSEIEAIRAIGGVALEQKTPLRTLHRRADLTRARRLVEIAVEPLDPPRFALTVRAEAGTYVKEFISGDCGRTRPSVAAAIGRPCRVVELDVLAVHFDL